MGQLMKNTFGCIWVALCAWLCFLTSTHAQVAIQRDGDRVLLGKATDVPPYSLAVSADGQLMLASRPFGNGHPTKLVHRAENQLSEVSLQDLGGRISMAAIHPNGKFVACLVVQVVPENAEDTLGGQQAFRPEKSVPTYRWWQQLAVVDNTGQILWKVDLDHEFLAQHVSLPENQRERPIFFRHLTDSPDGDCLLLLGAQQQIAWDWKTGELGNVNAGSNAFSSAAPFLGDEEMLLSPDQVWNFRTGELRLPKKYESTEGHLVSVSMIPGLWLERDVDNLSYFLHYPDGKQRTLETPEGATSIQYNAASLFSPDGQRMAFFQKASGQQIVLTVWDVPKARITHQGYLPDENLELMQERVAFLGNDQLLVTFRNHSFRLPIDDQFERELQSLTECVPLITRLHLGHQSNFVVDQTGTSIDLKTGQLQRLTGIRFQRCNAVPLPHSPAYLIATSLGGPRNQIYLRRYDEAEPQGIASISGKSTGVSSAFGSLFGAGGNSPTSTLQHMCLVPDLRQPKFHCLSFDDRTGVQLATWNWRKGSFTQKKTIPRYPNSQSWFQNIADISSDGTHFAFAGFDGVIYGNSKSADKPAFHKGPVPERLQFDNEGTLLAITTPNNSGKRQVKILKVDSGEMVKQLEDTALSAIFARDAPVMVSYSEQPNPMLQWHSTKTWEVLLEKTLDMPAESGFAVSDDGKTIALSLRDERLLVLKNNDWQDER